MDKEQNGLVERLRGDLETITRDDRPLPWQVNSGCSYRRIGTEPCAENEYHRNGGDNVLCAVRQRSDGHLDLSMGENELAALCRIVNNTPSLLARIQQLEAQLSTAREALEWYEEQVRNCRKITREGDGARQQLDRDGGERALTALALIQTPEGDGK